jgi:hypothetical protein
MLQWNHLSPREPLSALTVAVAAVVLPVVTVAAVAVEIEPPLTADAPFIPVQLHIHGSLSERTGRMIDHAARNREIGVKVLWWSDHEGMTYVLPEHLPALAFDFETGGLTRWIEPFPELGFYDWEGAGFVSAAAVDTVAAGGEFSLQLTAEGAPGGSEEVPLFDGVYYSTNDLRLTLRSFFQEIELDLTLRAGRETPPGRAFAVRCELSHDAHIGEPFLLYFVAGGAALPGDTRTTFYRAMPALRPGEWGAVTLSISAVGRSLVEHGRDLHLGQLSLGWLDMGGDRPASIWVDDFKLRVSGPEGDDLLREQAAYLHALPESQPIHFVGTEVSRGWAGAAPEHLNIFSPHGITPLPDWSDPRYMEWGYPRNVIDWAHSQGFAVSLNHMFTATIEGEIPDLVREKRRVSILGALAYYADFVEVGYPMRGLPIEEHLQLWDDLLRRNSFQTGLGVTDSHDTFPWEETVNRFVTWVAVEQVTQARLLHSLLRGQAFFGDPFIVGADARLVITDPERRYAMGDLVLVGDQQQMPIHFRGRCDLPSVDLAVITVHETSADTLLALGLSGAGFQGTTAVTLSNACHVRVEVRDPLSGDLVLGSNPIVFRGVPPSADRPGLRLRRVIDLRL